MGQLRGQLVAAQARAPDKQRTSVRKSQSRPLLPPLADVAVANRCRGATQQKRRAACHSTTEGFVGKCSDAGQPWSRGACADAARLTTTIPSRALRAGRYARISRRHHATHDPLGAKSRTRRPPETEQRSKTPICSGPNPPPPAMGSHMLGLPLQIGPASSERRGSPSPPQSDQRKSSGARGVTSFSFHVDPPSRSEPAPIKPSLVRCQWRFFFPHSLRCLSLVIPHRHFCLFVPPATQFGKSFHHGREQGLGQDLRVRH